MTTATGFNIAIGSAGSVAGIVSGSVLAAILVAVGAMICCVVRELRLGLRERRDDETVRYMFDLCGDTAAAFCKYAEVLKTREGPP